MSGRDLEQALDRHGLQIQREHPLHEGVLYYLEARDAKGEEVLAWWSSLGNDTFREGRGAAAAVKREARALLAALEERS